MELKNIPISDEVFDSVNVSFNVNRPVDNKADMENMKMQYDCGAMSRQTIIDRSPYTTNTSLELQRIEDENRAAQLNGSQESFVIPDTKEKEVVIDGEDNWPLISTWQGIDMLYN